MKALRMLVLLVIGSACVAAASYDSGPCRNLRSTMVIAGDSEPGTRMVVSGVVYQPDGKTPAAGVTMYVYQTDDKGIYAPQGTTVPRLHGWLKTDARGRYEYSTIKPGPYPGRGVPRHIHVQFWSDRVPPQYADELLFEDDTLVGQRERERSRTLGKFAFVLKPVESGGNLLATQNFRLKEKGDTLEANILHGLSACEAK